MLDADLATDRTILPRATSQEIGATREEVIDGAVQRLELSRKRAGDAYALAEQHETNPRSVWGYVQGLTRRSQHTPWQDARFGLDRAASRLLTTVNWILLIAAVRAEFARPCRYFARVRSYSDRMVPTTNTHDLARPRSG